MKIQAIRRFLGLMLALLVTLPAGAKKQEKNAPSGGEEFFIISSVDLARNRLVLKHPTEVTELMLVTDKTSCVSEQGKSEPCKNLRAGDTVYVTSTGNREGARSAVRIRIGPMTVEEIHRKYLTFQ